MGIPSKKILTLCGLAGVLTLSHCATTQETVQECRKSASSFCERAAAAKDGGGRGSGAADAAARNAAYQECMSTQIAACGPP